MNAVDAAWGAPARGALEAAAKDDEPVALAASKKDKASKKE